MKKLINNLFSQISEEQVKNLTTVINETVAFEITQSHNRVFTAADLWNIQRNKRSVSGRRMSF